MKPDLATRLWRKVKKNGGRKPHMATSCWIWTGSKSKGYGTINVGGKPRLAHRVVYELETGAPCTAPVVMHLCDNPRCVRFDHLKAGTHAENMADCIAKGRHWKGKKPKPKRVWPDVETLRAAVAVLGPQGA